MILSPNDSPLSGGSGEIKDLSFSGNRQFTTGVQRKPHDYTKPTERAPDISKNPVNRVTKDIDDLADPTAKKREFSRRAETSSHTDHNKSRFPESDPKHRPLEEITAEPYDRYIVPDRGGEEPIPPFDPVETLLLNSTFSLDSFLSDRTSYVNTRASEINVFDMEAVLQTGIPTDVMGIYGGRRVTNYCLWSQDLKTSPWVEYTSGGGSITVTATQLDPDGGLTAFRIQATPGGTGSGDIARVHQIINFGIVGVETSNTVWIKNNGGSTIISFDCFYNKTVTINNDWQRYNNDSIVGAADAIFKLGVRGNDNSSAIDILVWSPQCENVTGQTNQNPSNHIPTTTAAVTKFYDTENGNTETDNVVTEAEGDAIESVIGGAFWPSVTNEFASEEYRNLSAWDSVTCNVTKDQVGVDGTLNSASTLEDDNPTGSEYLKKTFAIVNDSTWQSYSLMIKKDSDTSRYPQIRINLTGGTALNETIIINTQAGTANELTGQGEGEYDIFEIGDWWFITVAVQNNNSGNISSSVYIFPAYSTDGITYNNSITGSITVDWVQFVNARRCPTHLVRGGETLALADLHYSNDNLISADKGSIYVEFESLPDYSEFINDTVILSNGDCEIRAEALTGGVSFNDGTNNTLGHVETPTETTKAVIVWEGAEVKITTTSGTTTGTYAGNFGADTIYNGRNSTGSAFPGYISEISFYHDQALSDEDAALLVIDTCYVPIGNERVVDEYGEYVYDENGECIYAERE